MPNHIEGRATTADRIIEAAVNLFNQHGIAQVSLRAIAGELGISHGNLAYHFANKGKILAEVYRRMEAEMDDAVYPHADLTLQHYHQLMLRISAFHQRYRFFYLDMLEITRRYPTIITRYRHTIARRFEEYDQLMTHLVRAGLVKPEPKPGYYKAQYHATWVMSTFWLQHVAILGADHPVLQQGSDIQVVWDVLLPDLTEAGLAEYKSLPMPD